MSIKVDRMTNALGMPAYKVKRVFGFFFTYRFNKNVTRLSSVDTYKGQTIKRSKFTKKIQKFLEKIFPDFEVETKAQFKARMKANHDSEMEGSTITYAKKIHFYDEDVKKMKSMTHEEKLDYIIKLKDAKRYIEED